MFDGLDGGGEKPPPLPGALPGTLGSILGRARVVVTPYPFGVSDADNLRIVSVNSAAGITIEIHGRQAIGGFESKPFRYVHTPNSNRTAKTDDFVLGAGLVTNLSVFAAGGSPLIGQTFVIIQLIRSMGSVAYVMGTLLAGYVTSTQGLGWPGSAIESSIEGGGYIRNIVGTQPAAGNDFVETVPTGARWQLLRLSTTFRASGPGNRYPSLRVYSPSSGYSGLFFQKNPVNAGGNWTVTFSPTLSNDIDAVNLRIQSATPPDMIMLAGDLFQSGTPGMGGADQWDAPVYVVREWLEAP